jgi:hypothetical protein
VKRVLVIAVTAGLIGAGAASGAVAPLFDRASARVGERVTVRSGYAGAQPSGIVVWCKPCAPPRGDHWWMAAPNYVTNARAVLRITRK